ncbi:rho GDP-dissociation inhibitor 1-like [Phalaenopsis equestris]|uniref:rho GDP-dissociation inhibitor 1-like n=2 Tax=Phalaenopsis equestris TaxID=78828 RepID=UPI0009E2EAAE|nr:rho GDP-dissociation inhibitor 1-like [Phalaenopsis equestris]
MSTPTSKEASLHLEEGEEPSDSENELKRKMSSASVFSTDGGEDDDDDGEDDDDDRKGANVVLGPQLALKEQLEMDKDDESLRKWKEQLLAGVDLTEVGENPNPEVKIQSITIITPNRPDLVLSIPFIPNAKGYAFTLKDSSRYRLKFSFTVSNNIVSGLRYTNTVWKTGVRVENTKVMLGTFSPQKEPYTYELEEETTPSGIFARGSYSAKTKFVDDDGKCHLEMSYYFEIKKDWS